MSRIRRYVFLSFRSRYVRKTYFIPRKWKNNSPTKMEKHIKTLDQNIQLRILSFLSDCEQCITQSAFKCNACTYFMCKECAEDLAVTCSDCKQTTCDNCMSFCNNQQCENVMCNNCFMYTCDICNNKYCMECVYIACDPEIDSEVINCIDCIESYQ